jgi:hypothetical protein
MRVMLTRHFEESGEYCVFNHAAPALVFARPHFLQIDHQPTGQPQFRATITHLNAAGPVVKVELATGAGRLCMLSCHRSASGTCSCRRAPRYSSV